MSTDPVGQDTFVSHLMELRDRLLRSVLVVLAIFVVTAIFANDLYTFFAKPLILALPEGNSMISTQPHGPFFVPFKLAFAIAVIAAVPYLRLFEITRAGEIVWEFINPFYSPHPGQISRVTKHPSLTWRHSNAVFRAYRFTPDYPGLKDKDLVPESLYWVNRLYGKDSFEG